MTRALLGIDVGTSGIKAAVLDPGGALRGVATERVAVQRRRPTWAEQDMREVWSATAGCIRRCLAVSGVRPEELAAVGCCGQGDGAWMLDRAGAPLGPAILWNDNRAAELVQGWQASGALDEVCRRTGTLLWPGSQAGVLAWLERHDPGALASLGTVFCSKDWINYQLTGAIGTDRTDGSIPFTGARTRLRDRAAMEALGLGWLEAHLPVPDDSTALRGAITREAARETGLAEGTPVVAGLLDGPANAVGAGVIAAGQAMVCLGTSTQVCAVLGAPPDERERVGTTVLHAVPERWLRVLGTQAGTPNLDWAARALDGPGGAGTLEAVERRAAGAPVGSGAVLYHPFLDGERVPFLDPCASSAFFGITSRTTGQDLVRAVYEGVALSTRHCLSAIDLRLERIVLTGGGRRSPLWCQMIADACGATCVEPDGEELGVLGAAITAGIGVGLFGSHQEAARLLTRERRRYEPDRRSTERYRELAELYEELTRRMGQFWSRHAALRRRWEDAG